MIHLHIFPILLGPVEPDGKGETLELDNPNLDNSNYANWSSSKLNGGTPGSTNSKLVCDSLFINEFLVINDSIYSNEIDGCFSWVEFFNKSEVNIDFKNIYISDDYSSPGKSKIKSGLKIASKNSLLLSDGETNSNNGSLELKLNDSGGQIGLFLINGVDTTFIDSVTYGQQYSNISYGRLPDGYKRWSFFDNPTTNKLNSTISNHTPYFEIELEDTLILSSNSPNYLNIWEYVEDVETADSLLTFHFQTNSDSIRYLFDQSKGLLIFEPKSNYFGEIVLSIEIIDKGGLFIKDSLIIRSNLLTNFKKWDFPNRFYLEQNYPNPFNPTTTIRYELKNTTNVSLKIFDVLGREIQTIVNKKQIAGYYSVEFKAENLSSGIYYAQIIAGGYLKTIKMIFAK